MVRGGARTSWDRDGLTWFRKTGSQIGLTIVVSMKICVQSANSTYIKTDTCQAVPSDLIACDRGLIRVKAVGINFNWLGCTIKESITECTRTIACVALLFATIVKVCRWYWFCQKTKDSSQFFAGAGVVWPEYILGKPSLSQPVSLRWPVPFFWTGVVSFFQPLLYCGFAKLGWSITSLWELAVPAATISSHLLTIVYIKPCMRKVRVDYIVQR